MVYFFNLDSSSSAPWLCTSKGMQYLDGYTVCYVHRRSCITLMDIQYVMYIQGHAVPWWIYTMLCTSKGMQYLDGYTVCYVHRRSCITLMDIQYVMYIQGHAVPWWIYTMLCTSKGMQYLNGYIVCYTHRRSCSTLMDIQYVKQEVFLRKIHWVKVSKFWLGDKNVPQLINFPNKWFSQQYTKNININFYFQNVFFWQKFSKENWRNFGLLTKIFPNE